LFVVFAGIGVPIGIASASSGGTPAETALRLGEYTLTLPGEYHLTGAQTAPCTAVPQPAHLEAEAAAVTSRVCIVMFLAPSGYAPPRNEAVVVHDNLAIAAAGLSRGQLGELVTAGLRPAA